MQNQTSSSLYLLEGQRELQEHSLAVARTGRRELFLYSRQLNPGLYHRTEFVQALSDFARSSRISRARILVADANSLVEQHHLLLPLIQRLPSKLEIQVLSQESLDEQLQAGFLIADRDGPFYQHDEAGASGFANYQAGPEIKPLRETFQRHWHQSSRHPYLRRLSL